MYDRDVYDLNVYDRLAKIVVNIFFSNFLVSQLIYLPMPLDQIKQFHFVSVVVMVLYYHLIKFFYHRWSLWGQIQFNSRNRSFLLFHIASIITSSLSILPSSKIIYQMNVLHQTIFMDGRSK